MQKDGNAEHFLARLKISPAAVLFGDGLDGSGSDSSGRALAGEETAGGPADGAVITVLKFDGKDSDGLAGAHVDIARAGALPFAGFHGIFQTVSEDDA